MKSFLRFIPILLGLMLAGKMMAGECIWKGGGANDKWSEHDNWVDQRIPANGDTICFTGISTHSCHNDLANILAINITFDSDADSFVVNGKTIRLAGDIVNKSKRLQTVNLYITLTANSTFVTEQGGDLSIGSMIKGDKFGITKDGLGVLTLSGTNSYLGQTKVNAGTLVLGNDSSVSSLSAIILNGGALVFASSVSPTLGALKVESPSVIDFAGGAHTVKFEKSGNQSWSGTLAIFNWNGAETTHVLGFGVDNSALTTEQLSRISFYSDAGTTLLGTGTWADSNGHVTFVAPAKN